MTRIFATMSSRQAAAAAKESPFRLSAPVDASRYRATVRRAEGPHETVEARLRRAEALGHHLPLLFADVQRGRAVPWGDDRREGPLDGLTVAASSAVSRPPSGEAGSIQRRQQSASTDRGARSAEVPSALQRSPGITVKSQAVPLAKLQEIAGTQSGLYVFTAPEPTDVEFIEKARAQYEKAPSWGAVTVLGFTTTPRLFLAPVYNFDIKRTGDKAWDFWYPTLEILMDAFEGVITAYYVKPGKHYTGKSLKGGRPINLVVSSEMSELGRKAEEEHIDDYSYAFRITLQEAQSVLEALKGDLTSIRSDTPEGGGSLSDWHKAALKIQAQGEIARRLPRLGSDPQSWEDLYEERFQRSGIRDGRGWHTMVPGGVEPTPAEGLLTAKITSSTNIGAVSPEAVVGWDSSL